MNASSHDTKDRLVRAAKKLFGEKGFDGTTVKDISDAAGVNVSLVSYHFEGKEGLYRFCLEQFGRAHLTVFERILQTPHSVEDLRIRLQLFMDEMFTAHLEEPDLSRIIHRECDLNFGIAEDIFRDTFLKLYQSLVLFLTSAQDTKVIRKEIDAEALAGFLFGSIVQTVQKDKMSERYFKKTIREAQYREHLINTFLNVFLHGSLEPHASSSTTDPSSQTSSYT